MDKTRDIVSIEDKVNRLLIYGGFRDEDGIIHEWFPLNKSNYYYHRVIVGIESSNYFSFDNKYVYFQPVGFCMHKVRLTHATSQYIFDLIKNKRHIT